MPQMIDNHVVHSNCPLCRAADMERIGEITYASPTLYSSHKIALMHAPELWRCRSCGSQFTQHIVPVKTARDLYQTGASNARWGGSLFELTKPRESVNTLIQLFRNGARLMDVGSSNGELLDFAKAHGCSTAGVEYSEPARDILRSKGHAAYFSLEEAEGDFDIITAFDLFEHLYDTSAFLESCRSKLTRNGCLVILTGDSESLSSRLTGVKWWYARYPEHIIFPSLRYFSSIAGFALESVQRTYASVDYKRSPLVIALGTIARMAIGRYRGLPSLGPDHRLIVLRKTSSRGPKDAPDIVGGVHRGTMPRSTETR